MSEFDDLQKLLRLKRYEQPPEGYFEKFAEDFKERQRAELLQQSSRTLLVERISTWMWSHGTKRWLYVGGATTALLAAGYYFTTGTADPSGRSTTQESLKAAPESVRQ